MKVAYISSPYLADCDVPLLSFVQKDVELTYIIRVTDASKGLTLLKIGIINKESGLYPASEFTGLDTIAKCVDLSNVYIFYQASNGQLSLSNIESVFQLRTFLERGHYDIIHLTMPLGYSYLPLYSLRRKMILTVHDPLPHSSNITRSNTFLRKLAFKNINNFIILNSTQKEEFIQTYGLQKKNIYESRLSIYTYLSDISPIEPNAKGYVLFFGQISSYKGLDILCEAMRKVKLKMPDAKLIVAGRGNLYFDINQYVQDKTIEFRNYYIQDDELAGLIKNAAFTVCPYRDATQSGVIMSSFSLGTPVVVSDVGALPEMVGNGKYGSIVPAGKIEVLAETIEYLLMNPQSLNNYRDNIKRDYNEGDYSWNKIAFDIIQNYKDCLTIKDYL